MPWVFRVTNSIANSIRWDFFVIETSFSFGSTFPSCHHRILVEITPNIVICISAIVTTTIFPYFYAKNASLSDRRALAPQFRSRTQFYVQVYIQPCNDALTKIGYQMRIPMSRGWSWGWARDWLREHDAIRSRCKKRSCGDYLCWKYICTNGKRLGKIVYWKTLQLMNKTIWLKIFPWKLFLLLFKVETDNIKDYKPMGSSEKSIF